MIVDNIIVIFSGTIHRRATFCYGDTPAATGNRKRPRNQILKSPPGLKIAQIQIQLSQSTGRCWDEEGSRFLNRKL